MRNLDSKGFGIIGLIIVIAIIVFMIFGLKKLGLDKDKNQVEAGRDAVDQARDAAGLQNEYNIEIQNQLP